MSFVDVLRYNFQFGGFRPSTERTAERKAKVDLWTDQNLPSLFEALHTIRSFRRKESVFNQYSDLSELPLCRSWYFITPPSGFKVEYDGRVTVVQKDGRALKKIDHVFAINRHDEVLCFTFGQFYTDQYPETCGIDLLAGEAVEKYQQMAPELVTCYPGGLARLYGRVDQIREQLGLLYLRK